jgi:hypothetical protein
MPFSIYGQGGDISSLGKFRQVRLVPSAKSRSISSPTAFAGVTAAAASALPHAGGFQPAKSRSFFRCTSDRGIHHRNQGVGMPV